MLINIQALLNTTKLASEAVRVFEGLVSQGQSLLRKNVPRLRAGEALSKEQEWTLTKNNSLFFEVVYREEAVKAEP